MSPIKLNFLPKTQIVTSNSPVYQLPTFPPPDNWVISLNEKGYPLSRYGDDYWDYRAFSDGRGFNWGKQKLSEENLRLAKKVMILNFYHPYLFPGKIKSCKTQFECLIKVAKLCDENKILISDLSNFPKVASMLANRWTSNQYETYLSILHKWRLYKDILGFEIVNEKSLAFLTSQKVDYEVVQHPYIPPKIWSYQVNRFNECIDEFWEHYEEIKEMFNTISHAYNHNLSLGIDKKYGSPFNEIHLYDQRITYEGGFVSHLQVFGLLDLFEKWLGPKDKWLVTHFSTYLNLIRDTSLLYILNFSLQRLSEVGSLRSDCFEIEVDDKLGDIALISGITSKTDPDDDARWVVPKAVKKAVDAAGAIAKWRQNHRPHEFKKLDLVTNPWLATPTWDIWSCRRKKTSSLKVTSFSYAQYIKSYPNILNEEEITVTEEDWNIALSITPNLVDRPEFGIGQPWRFSAH